MVPLSVLAVVLGYAVGSIPTAWLVARHVSGAGTDVRLLGNGNAGATNVGRVFGARWGVLVGGADIFKGFAVVFAFSLLAEAVSSGRGHDQMVLVPPMLAGAAAVVGHIWPVWLGFRGGRGAATAIGVAGAMFTAPMLVLTMPMALVLLVTRNTSLVFCLIYYCTLMYAKVAFDAPWPLIVSFWVLAVPVIVTDPRMRRRGDRFPRFHRWRRPDPVQEGP